MIFAEISGTIITNIVIADVEPIFSGFTYLEASEANLNYLRGLTNGLQYFPIAEIKQIQTTTESVRDYLDSRVFPFTKNLLNTFAAENIAMGITQAGKADDLLGMYEQLFPIIGSSKPVSLKSAFDTGSLFVAISIIQHIRDNPIEYTGMSPFVTDARLLQLKNKIETFLEVPLSI